MTQPRYLVKSYDTSILQTDEPRVVYRSRSERKQQMPETPTTAELLRAVSDTLVEQARILERAQAALTSSASLVRHFAKRLENGEEANA